MMRILRLVQSVAVIVLLGASPLSAGWTHLGDVERVDVDRHRIVLGCGSAEVQITAVRDGVIRIRLAPDGHFGREFSWAVIDPQPRGQFHVLEALPAADRPGDGAESQSFSTGRLRVTVHNHPCRLTITDEDEHRVLVSQDMSKGLGWDGEQVAVWHTMPADEHYLGLGEKVGPLDKRNMAFTNWTVDCYGYRNDTDPLYKAIPFFMVARAGRYAGIFFDNSYRTFFDFGKSDRNVYRFGAEGGELDYYVIAGPTPKDVLRRYTDLTGRMPLPPKWAIGYQQCRYSYFPDSRVLEIAQTFREKEIPCDVIYLDIDYMDQYRCFTWHPKYFPDPTGLISKLHDMGFKVVTIIDPGIKKEPGYPVYDEGLTLDAFVKNADGSAYVGRVWPGPCVFPDFTNPSVRGWWGGLHRTLLDVGVDGIWTDMNEPADFAGPWPRDVVHDNEGELAPHPAVHNVYGLQMARATYEGLRKLAPEHRPFVITRSAYAGVQRYATVWTGDNSSTWEHLRMSIAMCQGLSISGVPFVGSDIGGFVGGAYPELYARWIQCGALMPFSRTHTELGNADQEPWSFGPQVEQIARDSINLRYRLLPYMYTLFHEAAQSGTPVIRPVFFEFPESTEFNRQGGNFLLGSDLFVAPVTRPHAKPYQQLLPPGAWFDWHTDDKVAGEVTMSPTLPHMPMFVRGGAIIPTQSVVQNTQQKPDEPLILEIYAHGASDSTLYEDAADGYADHLLTTFACQRGSGSITFEVRGIAGNYKPPRSDALLKFHGIASEVREVRLNGTELTRGASANLPAGRSAWHYDAGRKLAYVRLADRTVPAKLVLITEQSVSNDAGTGELLLGFDADDNAEAWSRGWSSVIRADGETTYAVRGLFDPTIVGPTLWLNGEKAHRLQLRMASQNARKVWFRFGTFDAPSLAAPREVEIVLTPDGHMHEYEVDLAEACAGQWNNIITGFRLDFETDLPIGSAVSIDQLSID